MECHLKANAATNFRTIWIDYGRCNILLSSLSLSLWDECYEERPWMRLWFADCKETFVIIVKVSAVSLIKECEDKELTPLNRFVLARLSVLIRCRRGGVDGTKIKHLRIGTATCSFELTRFVDSWNICRWKQNRWKRKKISSIDMNDKLNVMRRVNYILDSTEKENNNGNKIGVSEKKLKEKIWGAVTLHVK